MKHWTGDKNSTYRTIGARNIAAEEREDNDFYATDPKAIDRLLTVESPSQEIWECACGEGHLSRRLSQHGYNVYSSDLIDRGFGRGGIDFLNCNLTPAGDILTNPPYKQAMEFVLKALELLKDGQRCYMFLKVLFLEGKTRREKLFSKFPPQRVHVFSERILCAKNADFERTKNSGGGVLAYAWFVWEKGWIGKTMVDWI